MNSVHNGEIEGNLDSVGGPAKEIQFEMNYSEVIVYALFSKWPLRWNSQIGAKPNYANSRTECESARKDEVKYLPSTLFASFSFNSAWETRLKLEKLSRLTNQPKFCIKQTQNYLPRFHSLIYKRVIIWKGLATHPGDLIWFNAAGGRAVPLGRAGPSPVVSHWQLLCCRGNTNKRCCFGLTQFRVINNNKNSNLPCMTPCYALQEQKFQPFYFLFQFWD